MTDERLAEIEQTIMALGIGTPEYYDALGFYFMTLARAQWRMADRIRGGQADSARRREAAAKATETKRAKKAGVGTRGGVHPPETGS